jgi:hypothetical protein
MLKGSGGSADGQQRRGKKELSGSIDFGTTLLAEQQAEYIELVNEQFGIQPPAAQD